MIKIEDECVGCPTEMGCLGSNCKYSNVPHLICDECELETTLYHFNGRQLCIDCIIDELEEVTLEYAMEEEEDRYYGDEA